MECIDFDDARKFLSYLRLSNEHWLTDNNQWQSEWIFRGQPCSSLDLTPSLFRERNRHLIIDKAKEFEKAECKRRSEMNLKQQPEKSADEQKYFEDGMLFNLAEARLIRDFIHYSDGAGLEMPSFEKFKSQMNNNGGIIEWRQPNPPHPVIGFAQHHGIPTRLLDWTRNPLFASFFALLSVKSDEYEGMFTVWAIRSDVLKNHKLLVEVGAYDGSMFEMMEVKKSENKFLFSQEGLFTFNRRSVEWYSEKGEFPKIENLLDKIEEHTGEKVFRKLCLLKSQRSELTRNLHIEGITQIRLMPYYGNVIKTMALNYLST